VETIIPMSYPSAQKLGDHLKLAKAKNEVRVLDLAAGSGIWGIVLTQKSSRVRVTAVDWAGMIPTTKRITQKFGVAERFKYVEGDLLEADFGTGHDIATLGHILHSEGEERSRQLLKKTFRALKSGGTIAIAEWLVRRHLQLQRDQKLARRSRVQKSPQTRRARSVAAHPGHEAVNVIAIANRLFESRIQLAAQRIPASPGIHSFVTFSR
jgi:ubiquinone/menaquinone biosynthesis C-methylase UbiE